MGAGSSTQSNIYAPLSLMTQDLERLKFAQNLRANPEDYNAYVAQKVDELSEEVYNRKRTAFQKAHIDLGRYMDLDHNAAYYKTRSADVDRLLNAIESNNNRVVQGIQRDKDVTRRQFEINEWYNYNKLETLFFLQVFFISSLLMAVVIFLQKNSTITNAMASLLTGILLIVVSGLGLYRYYYTNRGVRDPRLWHRRYFGSAAAPKPPVKCDANGNIDIDINSVIPKDVTQCADEAAQRFGKWQDALENEMLAYQTTGESPSRITGNKSAAGLMCSKFA